MSNGPYDPADIRLESSLGYYLSKARNVLGQRMDRALEPLGLTASQIGVMLLLLWRRANTPYDLSRELSYDSGSMTRMLDRLEKKGLIVRSRSSTDRRVVELTLTAPGEDAARQLPAIIARVLNEQLRGFSEEEVTQLESLLGRFIANAPDVETGGCPVAAGKDSHC
ncbi:MarR family winged helix-turn-helix transcriptional regulator [Paraburkholderia kururiensis]|uniref:MarR family transcriptional regulator n=1 Tax=Paraburkholderia kururiensis TaxID=984307 RepID=A0ABZ0WFZ5_9BURK|nr:MarR family transcriptional regulator [Paraburkholderia kururiensis]WQD76264.1 MarR family transcriptional regulator [Paraburkholderia kururiensis]